MGSVLIKAGDSKLKRASEFSTICAYAGSRMDVCEAGREKMSLARGRASSAWLWFACAKTKPPEFRRELLLRLVCRSLPL